MEVLDQAPPVATPPIKRVVFDCADCGRHIEQNDPLSKRMRMGLPRRIDGVCVIFPGPLCAHCTYCPEWYYDPIFRQMFDPDYFRAPMDS